MVGIDGGPETTSPDSAEAYREALALMLGRASDEFFFRMVWAVDAVHTGRADEARQCGFVFESSVATPSLETHRVFHWEMETLINEILMTPKVRRGTGIELHLDCGKYWTALECARVLRKLEDAEDRGSLDRVGVFSEMHRLTQRQFEWQRGFDDVPSMYRSARLFGQGPAGAYFQAASGLSVADFVLFGIALLFYFSRQPAWDADSSMAHLGVSDEMRDKGFALLAAPLAKVRQLALKLRPPELHTAYRPSVLRKFPIVRFDEDSGLITAPILGLIMHRVTSGLYLDVVGGGNQVWRTIGKEFEKYAHELLEAMLPSLSVTPERRYRFKKNNVDGPDIEIARDGRLSVIVECKAKRLTFAARFSEDPFTEAGEAYGEIIKGVMQIWRYAARIRRGLVEAVSLAAAPVGMILTLDPWLAMANVQGRQVMDAARRTSLAEDPDIQPKDQVPILFTSIQELERCLLTGTEESFLSAVQLASDGEHEAWLLSSIHDRLLGDDAHDRDYPFMADLDNVLPWWSHIRGEPR